MTDFFGRLAARTLGTADAVRPRVPSMFEPTAGPRPQGEGEPAIVDEPVSRPWALQPGRHDETIDRRGPAIGGATRHDDIEIMRAAPREQEPVAEHAITTEAAFRPPTDRPSPKRTRSEPVTAGGLHARPGRQQAIQPRVSAGQPERHDRPASRADQSANPRTEIHVTIGRVEVRAVAAPSAPERDAAPLPPAVSLDAYLKDRRGRAR